MTKPLALLVLVGALAGADRSVNSVPELRSALDAVEAQAIVAAKATVAWAEKQPTVTVPPLPADPKQSEIAAHDAAQRYSLIRDGMIDRLKRELTELDAHKSETDRRERIRLLLDSVYTQVGALNEAREHLNITAPSR